MAKQSKITVKHYLNDRLKPEIENGVEKYPVFCMIIFNRHTIRRKSITFLKLSINEFENKAYQGKYKKQIDLSLKYEIDIFNRIVEKFAIDLDKKNVSNKFLNFDSRYTYTSKNNELNQLNSYLNYYLSNIKEALSRYVYNENVIFEFKEKLEKVFNFGTKSEIKQDIIELLGNAEIFASDWDFDENVMFLKNNISEKSMELVFLTFCFEQFENYYETKITGFWCVPIFEWIFNYNETAKNYINFTKSNTKIIEFSKKIEIKFNENIILKQLETIKHIANDKDFHIKNKC
ncbi:hypothetical protein [Flavobacterium branchiophilum]|uniref:Uncharacterized protein n=1 Tax=Flavobacterium branchiophilum TaxID=55197 RepID=A0A2H3KQ13_9FLAO|nr:hypothetical protein [Flavobacterium branchiophilum]PDS23552.1 hypothetical protein B0A77_10630 [Flavobacterium branchiophilum]